MLKWLLNKIRGPQIAELQTRYQQLELDLGLALLDLAKANNEIARRKLDAEMAAEHLVECEELARRQAARIEQLEFELHPKQGA